MTFVERILQKQRKFKKIETKNVQKQATNKIDIYFVRTYFVRIAIKAITLFNL